MWTAEVGWATEVGQATCRARGCGAFWPTCPWAKGALSLCWLWARGCWVAPYTATVAVWAMLWATATMVASWAYLIWLIALGWLPCGTSLGLLLQGSSCCCFVALLPWSCPTPHCHDGCRGCCGGDTPWWQSYSFCRRIESRGSSCCGYITISII